MFKFTLPFLFISCFSFSQVPTASFSAVPTTACIGGTTVFTNTSIGATPLSYLWNFGDSTFSTLPSPTHTFTSSGTFNVTLLTTAANTGSTFRGNLTGRYESSVDVLMMSGTLRF